MNELPLHHRPRRVRALALAAALCALGVLLGGASARGDDGSGREEPTIQVTVDPTSAVPGQNVTLTAVITGTTTYPAGTVKFTTADDPTGAIEGASALPVQPVSGSSLEAKATLDTRSFQSGTYEIVAYWTPTDPFTFQPADSTGSPIELVVADTTPKKTGTTTTLTIDPATVVQGQDEALTATVTADDGSIPTGEVFFYDGDQQLGDPVQLDANGVATNPDVGSFGAGHHELSAHYQGSGLYKPSQSDATSVDVADTSPNPTTTHLDLTVSKPVIRQGDTVDLTAHVTQTGGAIVPPGGEVTFYSNVDCNSGTLLSSGNSSSAPVDENGNATLLGVGSWAVQDYTLCASYVGDSFGPSSGTASLTVLAPLKTATLDLTGPSSAVYKTSSTFTAHLADSAGDLSGKAVTIQFGSQSCSASTDSSGNVQCTFAVTDTSVSTVSASFAGDLAYGGASDSQDFAVAPAPTTLTVTMHGPTVLQGTLVETNGGAPIANVALDLSLGEEHCPATTNSSGFASCTIDRVDAESATLAGTSAADARYQQGTFSQEITIPTTIATTLDYTGPSSGDFGDDVTLTARLTDGSSGLDGQTIVFTLGSQTCSGTTSPDGVASCTLTPRDSAGAATLEVRYAGDGSKLGSSADAAFTITPEETTLSLTAPAGAQQGSMITLTAKLLEDGTTPVDGRAVTFTYGGTHTCTGTTTAGGLATCLIPATSLGPLAVSASFTSDGYYAPARTAAQTLYVYAPMPGGGMFVVGDRSATGNVTFWGSQWSKLNDLSDSSAPSAFKGYALHASTTCGGTWSTDPGNSTPPPARPLPAYIAVIVTSSAAKSRSEISGHEAHVVIVKTSAGYDGNPGHAGTGTVVATLC